MATSKQAQAAAKRAAKEALAAAVKAADLAALAALDLRLYDVILLNTSAGKDSLAMIHHVYQLAVAQGVTDRLVAVHCDLGRVEWEGTRELAQKQCDLYGIRLHVVSRPQGDLLTHVEQKGMWPASNARYCTSEHKRGQVETLMTALVDAFINQLLFERGEQRRRVRILNCQGLRASESPKRAAKAALAVNERATNGKRLVTDCLPIKWWSDDEVWACIRSNNLPYHFAYDLGMPRLSCVFCFYAPEKALLLAGYHNRALLAEYVRVERATGHDFKHGEPLIQIQAKLDAGYVPAGQVAAAEWSLCA